MSGKKKETLIVYGVFAIIPIVFIILGLQFRYQTAKYFPIGVSILMLVLIAIAVIGELLKKEKPAKPAEKKEENTGETWAGYGKIGIWLVGLFGLIYFIGFVYSIPLFIFAFMKTHGIKWVASILSALIIWGVVYLVFIQVFKIQLYEGIIFLDWLG